MTIESPNNAAVVPNNAAGKSRGWQRKLKAAGLVGMGAAFGVALSLNFSAVAERQGSMLNLPIEDVRMLSEVFGRIKADYVEPVDDKRLIREAINGMLNGLDPHSAFLDQDAFREMQTTTTGRFSGIGIEVGVEEGFVKVISPIDDSPAYKAGIKAGDFILKVGDTNLRGLSLNEAVKRMRGEAGTEAILTVLRRGESDQMVFNVRRAVIDTQSVRARQLESGIVYVRVSQFEGTTADKMARAIIEAYKQNNDNVRGMILDLRNDPGGVLNASVAVSAAFLPKDALVVYTDGRVPESKMRLQARREDYMNYNAKEDPLAKLPAAIKTVPLVVLVNNGSASASEIVAGALQDHKRATIMGSQTFGKGSVQTDLPLGNNTAIKLTTARYFTPNGRAIQAKGISPDVKVEDGLTRISLREADLERHLTSDEERKAIEALKLAPVPKLPDQTDGTSPDGASNGVSSATKKGEKPIEYKALNGQDGRPIDFVLQQALNHLNGTSVAANPREWLALVEKADAAKAAPKVSSAAAVQKANR